MTMRITNRLVIRNIVRAGLYGIMLGGIILVFVAVASFFVFDHYNPPVLPGSVEISVEVVDADDQLLRAFVTKQGRWRLRTRLSDVDSEFLKLLIAYEDQRYWRHRGVDLPAMARAFGQLVTNGRIVSGASTITMQLARLLEPREKRSLGAKLHQMFRALQLELRLDKSQILEAYLMLAPYGGNLEGIRAASLAYFGKEPKGLTLSQSALLVALPQSPERRRPDRFAGNARVARDTVLARAQSTGIIAVGEKERAALAPVSGIRHSLPQYAAHLAQRVVAAGNDKTRHQLSLNRNLQMRMEEVVQNHAHRIDSNVSVALILADARSGQILAEVGSGGYLDENRSGWVDMSDAIRSPGSALKPFIYGLAFEQGLIKPETLITDAPANFAGYRPKNFDMEYQGEISIRKALQLSLNVPAVHLLEAVGPARLMALFKRSGVKVELADRNQAGLAIGLGGIGISLRALTQLYAGLANGGKIKPLFNGYIDDFDGESGDKTGAILQASAVWNVTDILAGISPPKAMKALPIAYKTGTSYGYRDAWSIGYDGRYVVGVWVGRADNGSVPGITGRTVAAPILFDAFAKSGLQFTPFKAAPAGSLKIANRDLPVTLQRFKTNASPTTFARVLELEPQIVYPPEGARVELAKKRNGGYFPLVMKLQNGRPPFRWLANGRPFSPGSRKRIAAWEPDGSGYSKLTVIDAVGRANSVNVYVSKIN